jgi:hypothetical protein
VKKILSSLILIVGIIGLILSCNNPKHKECVEETTRLFEQREDLSPSFRMKAEISIDSTCSDLDEDPAKVYERLE